jgi:hypothetical protein
MSHMSELSVEMQNLQANIEALRTRVQVERDISDYWYERCLKAEAMLNDEVNDKC